MSRDDLTPAMKRLLIGLCQSEHGGIFDRWVRIVASGKILTQSGSTTALTAFRRGLVYMDGDRVRLTAKGQEIAYDLPKVAA